MKFHNLLKIFGLSLPVLCFCIALSPTTRLRKEENWHGAKAEPFAYRYSENDIAQEPKADQVYSFNYQFMGLGGSNAKSSQVWYDHRGEKSDGNKITVAVIDSGLNIYHEDFLTRAAQGVNINKNNVEQYSIIDPDSCFMHDSSNGRYTSGVIKEIGITKVYDQGQLNSSNNLYYSHGTASASCIGAAVNGVGGWGIAPNVNLLIIKMDFYLTTIDQAIRYAADKGADVINMSLGIYAQTFTDKNGKQHVGTAANATYLQSAIDYANSKDCVVVAAAGNEYTDIKSYPASNHGVVGVGALDKKSGTSRSWYSNINSTADTNEGDHNVDVVAPGSVFTANGTFNKVRNIDIASSADNNYVETQGTSFACPLTAGAIALYRGKYPGRKNSEVISQLENTCTDIGSKGWDNVFGYGRVNVQKFLSDGVALTSIEINPSEKTLNITDENSLPTFQPSIIYTPNNADATFKKGLWISEDENVCTVDESTGLITAIGVGTTRVGFLTEIDGLEAYISINVTKQEETPNIPKETKTISININKHASGSGYGWHKWTSTTDNISGYSYIFRDEKNKMQFNSSKNYYYVYNDVALPNRIVSISLKGSGNDKIWSVSTGNSAFKPNENPSTIHTFTAKNVTSTAYTKFDINNNDKFFKINYESKSAGYLNDIIIEYVGVPEPDKTISLDKKDLNLTVGESYKLIATANGIVTWSSSNSNIATVNDDGLVKAIAPGSATITAKNGNASATCQVTIKNDYELDSITLSGEIPTTVPFKSDLDTSKIIVTANYTNSHPSKSVNAIFSQLDTSTIGTKNVKVTYKEGNIEKSAQFNVFVTNQGATRTETTGVETSYKTTISINNYFSDKCKNIKGGHSEIWTLNNINDVHLGINNSHDENQFGSKNNHAPNFNISCDYFKNIPIESITVSARSNSSNLSVSLNDKLLSTADGTQIIKLSNDKCSNFIFTANDSGTIKINFTDNGNAAYLKNIIVKSKKGTTYSWSGDEQAKSFLDYLKGFKSCSNNWQNRDQIKQLVNEYNFMLQDAKDSQILKQTFMDNNYKTDAINKLKTIVDQYNNSLKPGEEKLTLILKVNEQNEPILIYSNEKFIDSYNLDWSYILVTIIVSITCFTFFIVFAKKQRKHN